MTKNVTTALKSAIRDMVDNEWAVEDVRDLRALKALVVAGRQELALTLWDALDTEPRERVLMGLDDDTLAEVLTWLTSES